MPNSLYEYILLSAESGLTLQLDNGSMPSGNNGPYLDPETPVRNTGHWLIIFLKAFYISEDQKFEQAAKKCLSYLLSKEARPMHATFFHRKNPLKDATNGLIGQAWTIEALLYAFDYFKDDRILKLAEEVFLLHPYDDMMKGWKVVNVDGSIKSFDLTFNHQLWFAAIGSLLAKHGNKEVIATTNNFIYSIETNIEIYGDGTIKHKPLYYMRPTSISKLRARVELWRQKVEIKSYINRKSIGYHGFNLYALGIIKETHPKLPFFNSEKFKSTLKVISSKEFGNSLKDNKYAYPYNPIGIELAYALQVFEREKEAPKWLEENVRQCYDFELKLMGRNSQFDKPTAAARMYEAYRLKDYNLDLHG